MTSQELRLLENLPDALDRLFDRHSLVIDIHSLLFATSEALRGTEFSSQVERPIRELESIVRSRASAEQKRDSALIATDNLRKYLAKVLPHKGRP
jgi:hypothetical protein